MQVLSVHDDGDDIMVWVDPHDVESLLLADVDDEVVRAAEQSAHQRVECIGWAQRTDSFAYAFVRVPATAA